MATPIQEALAAIFGTSAPVALLASTLLTGIPAFLIWWFGRRDKQFESREKALDDQQKNLNDEQSQWFGALREELRDAKKTIRDRDEEIDRLRLNRDHGWNLARYHHGVSHEVARAYSDLRHDYVGLWQWSIGAVKRCASLKEADGTPSVPAPERVSEPPPPIRLPIGIEETKQ